MLKALFALVAATLFAGAALYISLVEHPARMKLDDRSALAQWKPSYGAATPLQAGLALLSLILGLWAWWKAGDDGLLVAAPIRPPGRKAAHCSSGGAGSTGSGPCSLSPPSRPISSPSSGHEPDALPPS